MAMTARASQSAAVTPVSTSNHYGVSTLASDARPDGSAMSIILKHFSEKCYWQYHAAGMNQRLICTVAMVCKGWNTAVLHADIGDLSIKPNNSRKVAADSNEAQRLDDNLLSLAIWLPKYGRLVRELNLSNLKNIESTLLQIGLHAAAKQGMQLRSFTTDVFHNSTFLRALPCASLTHLRIQDCDGTALAAVLPWFEQLQALRLTSIGVAACLPVLHQLSKLTALAVKNIMDMDILETQQLPKALQHLELEVSNKQVSLAHLTRLASLVLSINDGTIQQGPALPEHLLDLLLKYVCKESVAEALQLTTLTQLKCLQLCINYETAPGLLELARLPRLQKMVLEPTLTTTPELLTFMAASSAWPQIYQLQDLILAGDCDCRALPQLPNVLCHIAACTGLTRLTLGLRFSSDVSSASRTPVDLCQCVSKQRKLRELSVVCSGGVTCWGGQAVHLRPLTSLTRLALSTHPNHGALSDDSVLASLLQLRQLQWLRVPVRSIAVLPVIGSVRELRHLVLSDITLEACCLSILSHLFDLEKLSSLTLKPCEKVSAQFWDAVNA